MGVNGIDDPVQSDENLVEQSDAMELVLGDVPTNEIYPGPTSI